MTATLPGGDRRQDGDDRPTADVSSQPPPRPPGGGIRARQSSPAEASSHHRIMEGPPREGFPGALPGDRLEIPDPSAPAPSDIRQADRLYQPFPDFASWKGLAEADRELWDRFAKGLE